MKNTKCKHSKKFVKRFREYVPGDFYKYMIECKCGLKICGWTPNECELEFKNKLKRNKL